MVCSRSSSKSLSKYTMPSTEPAAHTKNRSVAKWVIMTICKSLGSQHQMGAERHTLRRRPTVHPAWLTCCVKLRTRKTKYWRNQPGIWRSCMTGGAAASTTGSRATPVPAACDAGTPDASRAKASSTEALSIKCPPTNQRLVCVGCSYRLVRAQTRARLDAGRSWRSALAVPLGFGV